MTVQIAVKLPDDLVASLDRLVEEGVLPNRSVGIRRAVEQLLEAEARRRIDASFTAGFSRCPDDGAELAEATRLAIDAIEDEPWERWW